MVVIAMSRFWRRSAPRAFSVGPPRWRAPAAVGATVFVLAGGLGLDGAYLPSPGGEGPGGQTHLAADAAHHKIIVPDLAVIEPSGLDQARLSRLGRIHGVRHLLPVDGASITIGGQHVNVIGVKAQVFRSWTPLSTASDTKLWRSLAGGGFVASHKLARKLRLKAGTSYPLTGGGTVSLPFAGAAPVGLTGIDVVVSSASSSQLGLIHNVAALISAPTVAIGKLKREVRAALGGTGTVVGMRPGLPVDRGGGSSGRPGTYLELFHASAARYCPGMSWTVLAAIAQIESGDGTNNGPSPAGALGPMQFMPATWATWGMTAFGEPGPPNIMDPFDAVPAAAKYLCAAGASTRAGLPGAIFAYNHANWYVAEVLALAKQYAQAYG
jgi:transglycosylase-like protein with SLT domain